MTMKWATYVGIPSACFAFCIPLLYISSGYITNNNHYAERLPVDSIALPIDQSSPGTTSRAEQLSSAPFSAFIQSMCDIHSLTRLESTAALVQAEELAREIEDIHAQVALAATFVVQYDQLSRVEGESADASPRRVFMRDGWEWNLIGNEYSFVVSAVGMFEFRNGRLCCSRRWISDMDHTFYYFLEGCQGTVAVHFISYSDVLITVVMGDAVLSSEKFRRHVPTGVIVPEHKDSCIGVELDCPKVD